MLREPPGPETHHATTVKHMRICLLAHLDFHPARDWALYLHDRGHEVNLLSLTRGAPVPGVHCEILRSASALDPERTNWQHLLALPRIWRRLRELRPARVIAMFASSNGVLAALALPRDSYLVQRIAGSDVERRARRSPIHRRAVAAALARAGCVISPAAHLTGIIQQELGVEADKILTLQSGIALDRIAVGLPAAQRPPLCLCARVLVPHAHTTTVLEAFKLLDERRSSLRLDLLHDGPQRERLEDAAAPLIRAGRVSFKGTVARTELLERLGGAPIYVSMTAPDGASTTLLEAMARGAFPVLSDIPANREWVRHGENGILVRPACPAVLADALERVWRDVALRDSAARLNRALVQERADFSRNMQIIEQRVLGLC
jgi:glycosyltransferase involved in cell wall biosynthesis